jgi:DNA polymerase-1
VRELVVDLEADGLDPTVIHVAIVKDLATGKHHEFYKDDGASFASMVRGCKLILHNGIGFDLPVLRKLWGYTHTGEVVDTLVLSRLVNPSIEKGHSLEAWGERLGYPKGDYNDWSKLTAEMVEYCKRDTDVTEKVYYILKDQAAQFTDQSIALEHRVAEIITQQQKNGWVINEREAHLLHAKLLDRQEAIEEEVRKTFIPVAKLDKEITLVYKKDGTLNSRNLKWLSDYDSIVWGNFTRIIWQEFNLGSRQQIAERLIRLGWKPTKHTDKGSVIVDEKVLGEVEGIPECSLLAEYFLVQKREAMIRKLIEKVESDGRVHGYVNSNGAVTGRMTHSDPNLAQIPAGYSPYGKEFRGIFTVASGNKLVGCDASGLELRMLAHYMNDEDYTNEILNGDIHTTNQLAAGLPSRDQAKTFVYSMLYGAGDAKIGSVVGGSSADGKRLKDKFLKNTPALASLRERVATAAKRGFLRGLDGRCLWIRSDHAALNTLLQSAGAIIMKQALIILDDSAKASGIKYKFVGNVHDEFQTEVEAARADEFGQLAVQAIRKSGEHFKLRCPLDGEYAVGDNWSQTH